MVALTKAPDFVYSIHDRNKRQAHARLDRYVDRIVICIPIPIQILRIGRVWHDAVRLDEVVIINGIGFLFIGAHFMGAP